MDYTYKTAHRVLKILECGNLEDDGNPIGYIYKNGNLSDYIQNIVIGKEFSNKNIEYIGDNIHEVIETDTDIYYVYYTGWEWKNGGNYIIYKELPRVESGETYKLDKKRQYYFGWQTKKDLTMELKFTQGMLEYICTYNGNDGYIDVRYTKCENKHRTNVTIERIYLKEPTNRDFIFAIKDWKKTFRKELEI